jgi:aryl-alcohol dehydrogenase-like predicted oxidoreductase
MLDTLGAAIAFDRADGLGMRRAEQGGVQELRVLSAAWLVVRAELRGSVGLLSGAYSQDKPAPPGSLWATQLQSQFGTTMQGASGKIISTVHALAAELGKTPAQLALAWVLSHPEITVAITGGDTIEHLNNNVGAIGWTLDPSVREKLDAVSASLR